MRGICFMEMFETPSPPLFYVKRPLLRKYVKEFYKKSVIERLGDYLYKDMSVYFVRNEEETEYCISVEDLVRIGLTNLYPDDIVGDVKFALSRYLDDDFEIQYDKYGEDYTEQFVTITFDREWNEA